MSQEGLLKEQKAARHAQLAENAEVATAVKRKDEEVALERQEAQRQLKKKEQEITRRYTGDTGEI